MRNFIRVMKALSDPNRVKILKILELKGLCVCEITGVLGLAQSTVSKHLKILEDADLVESWKDGAWVNYTLTIDPDNQYAATMQKNIKGWLGDDPHIKEAKNQADQADRITICASNEIGMKKNGKATR